MRILSRRKSRSPRRSSPLRVAGESEIVMLAPASLSIEQLSTSGPATGPSHRTFVPIVRSIPQEISLGELNGVVSPTTTT